MKKYLRIAVLSLLTLVVIGLALALVAYRASQQEPEFYQTALAVESTRQAEAGDELEKHVLDLHNEVREAGAWEAVFTDGQINGWLAADLPEKFPQVLPHAVSDPRVSIDTDLARIACRYTGRKIATVISLGVSIQLTDQPNEIAIRLKGLHAGALPLPAVEKWKGQIERTAIKAGLPLRWVKVDGEHVAMVRVPMEHKQFKGQRLRLVTIQLRDGEVYLTGRSEPVNAESPPADVFQTASDSFDENLTTQR